MHDCVRIDVVHALLSYVHLVLTDGLARCDDLTIDVRQTYLVVIDEVERADAAACERLYRIAADAESRYASLAELFHALMTQQQFCSRKLV